MADFNPYDRSLRVRIVYYGPAIGGKTTNLKVLHRHMRLARRSEMISLNPLQDRTILFDMVPMSLSTRSGLDVRLQLVAVPGQAIYTATRRIALKGADGIVFVANSAVDRWYENVDSVEEMRGHLMANGIDPSRIPTVFQYNKRDLRELSHVDGLDRGLNPRNDVTIPAAAITGQGVLETFTSILAATTRDLTRRFPRLDLAGGRGPEEWARATVLSVFGRCSLEGEAEWSHPARAGGRRRETRLRVATSAVIRADCVSMVETYAEISSELSGALADARAQAARAEVQVADMRRAGEISSSAASSDLPGVARAALACLGEAAGAAHAALGVMNGTRLRAVHLPPWNHDPLLVDAGGRNWLRRRSGTAGSSIHRASEDIDLAQVLERCPEPFESVVVVPFRTGRRLLGFAIFHLLDGDAVPDTAALEHLDGLATVFALSIDRANRQPERRAERRPTSSLRDDVRQRSVPGAILPFDRVRAADRAVSGVLGK